MAIDSTFSATGKDVITNHWRAIEECVHTGVDTGRALDVLLEPRAKRKNAKLGSGLRNFAINTAGASLGPPS